ncbi:hypothetical protein HDU77_005190 [Chytriomyces hyalinus]|nr:hypothetical protein HDU77_005190 [Chytriomyces hyalinus]
MNTTQVAVGALSDALLQAAHVFILVYGSRRVQMALLWSWCVGGAVAAVVALAATLFGVGGRLTNLLSLILTLIANTKHFGTISARAFELVYAQPHQLSNSYDALLAATSTRVYRVLTLSIHCILIAAACALLPLVVADAFFTVAFAQLIAFFAFEFKFANNRWPFHRCIVFFEERALYFLMFGLPFAGLRLVLPPWLSSVVIVLVYPFIIILANRAKPLPRIVNSQPSSQVESTSANSVTFMDTILLQRVPLFWVATRVVDTLIYFFVGRRVVADPPQEEPQQLKQQRANTYPSKHVAFKDAAQHDVAPSAGRSQKHT